MRRQRPFVRALVCDVVSLLNNLPYFIKFRESLKKNAILVKIGAIPVNLAYFPLKCAERLGVTRKST
jgi:hypothetical protein